MFITHSYLKQFEDKKYQAFTAKLIPDTKYQILGIRTPQLKTIAKEVCKDTGDALTFLNQKHEFYEEYLLHGIVLAYVKIPINTVFDLIEKFLPSIDNWGICDCTVMGLKIFKKQPKLALTKIEKWLQSKQTYTIRFAIVALLDYFLDENFNEDIFHLVNKVQSANYYVKMAVAWFYSVALVKQYDSAIKYLESKTLDKFTHNKTISKACDSFRISNKTKQYLKSLKK